MTESNKLIAICKVIKKRFPNLTAMELIEIANQILQVINQDES